MSSKRASKPQGREIGGAKIFNINTGIFMRSVDSFLCLQRLRISSLSEGGQKNLFFTGATRKFYGEIFE